MHVQIEKALLAARLFLASKVFIEEDLLLGRPMDRDVSLIPDPILVEDLHGAPLFYEFRVLDGGDQIVGAIRCAADSAVGTPVLGYLERVLDPNAPANARIRFESARPGVENIAERFVCYSYPKVAVEVSGVLNGTEGRILYDTLSLDILATDPNLDGLVLTKREGFALKSYQDSVKEGSAAEDFYNSGFQDILKVVETAGLGLGAPETLKMFREEERDFEDVEYEYLSRYFRENPPAIRSYVLPVPVYGQETKDYCAMASAQMIFGYLGINKTQDEIAALMNYGPGGADPTDQLICFNKVFADRFQVHYDRDPTWGEAVDALSSNIPFKSAVGLHARVCRGWKRFDYLDPVSKTPIMIEYYLLINDPNPVGHGQTYWEAKDIHIYRNAVTFKSINSV